MRYDETRSIEAKVSLAHNVDELKAKIAERADGIDIRISPSMSALLSGPGFAISSKSPENQGVAIDQPTTWLWDITPKSGAYNMQPLTLTISAHVKIGEKELPHVVEALRREIDVQISIPERVAGFFGTNWQWFLGGVAVLFEWWI